MTAIKLRNLHIKPSFPITLTKNICQKFDLKGKNAIIQTLSGKNLTAVLKPDFCEYRGVFLGETIL